VETLQDEVLAARKILARARQPLDVIKEVEEKADELTEKVDEPVERVEPILADELMRAGKPATEQIPRKKPLRLGSKVYLRTLGTEGVVISLGEEEAEVQVGMMRVRARRTDLDTSVPDEETVQTKPKLIKREPVEAKKETREQPGDSLPAMPGIELDLRGQRVEEALEKLDRHLDSAFLAGMPWVRIIHGKGTGRLRDAVRETLTHNPQVKSYKSGMDGEGGDGVTVAWLRI
jgi:DNA mismatch repair protein MutS2